MAEVLFFGGNQSASLIAGANITLSSSGNSITIIGQTNSGATTFLAGVSSAGNTAGTTGMVNNQILFVGGTNVTLSQSSNGQSATVSIVGPVDAQSIGMSNLGNTDGTTGVASGSNFRYLFAGGSNITLSQSLNGSSGTLTINAGGILELSLDGNVIGAGVMTGPVISMSAGNNIIFNIDADNEFSIIGNNMISVGVSSLGNTAGDTGMVSNQLVLVGGTNITLSQSTDALGATISIIGNTDGTLEQWIPIDYVGNTTYGTVGMSSLEIFPAILEHFGSFSIADFFVSCALTTNPVSAYSGTISMYLGCYTRNASTLSMASSGSSAFTYQNSGSTSVSLLTGLRHMAVPIGLSMVPGNYWFGFMSKTASAGANGASFQNFGAFAVPAWVNDFNASQNATHQFMPGLGYYSAQTAALPVSIGFSQIVGSNPQFLIPAIDLLNFNFT